MGRFAKYFKGNEILPIPEIADRIAPRVLSLVVSDLKTKRLVGLTKEVFEELIRKAGIPCQYFCRKSFATWDVLLPTEKQAAKTAESDITTKHFRLQPEYKGTRRLRVTVCNVPAIITGEVLAAYLSAYGNVEEFNLLRSPAGTAYGDYAFRLCLTRDGFKAIPETLICGDRQMMVMVEGRRPRCWGCKQIGHIAKFCPQRPENKEKASTTTTTTTKDAAASTITKEAEAKGPGQVQPQNNQEGWTEVTKKRRGSPKQGGEKSPNTSPPQKQTKAQTQAAAATVTTTEPPAAAAAVTTATTTETPAEAAVTTTTETAATTTTEQPAAAAAAAKKQTNQRKPATPKTPTAPSPKKTKKKTKTYEEMETSTNLKRRRDSGEGAAKKICPEKTHPEAGPSSQPSPPVPSPLPPLPSTIFPPPKITLPSPPQQMAPLSPQQELFFKKHHRPYKIPLPRSQSAERAQPSGLARTPSLPSLSPTDFSSQELFPAIISPKRKPPAEKKKSTYKDENLSIGQIQRAAALCSAELEAVGDFQLRKALKPLASLEKIENLKVSNPTNFRSAAMVTTFVRSAGDRTKGVWKFLSTVCQTDTGIKLVELEHSSLKKCITYCSGRVPILVHPSLYRALKLKFPIDVGGITRDNRVTTELGTGSLRQAVGILTPKDFRPVVDDE